MFRPGFSARLVRSPNAKFRVRMTAQKIKEDCACEEDKT